MFLRFFFNIYIFSCLVRSKNIKLVNGRQTERKTPLILISDHMFLIVSLSVQVRVYEKTKSW